MQKLQYEELLVFKESLQCINFIIYPLIAFQFLQVDT